MPPPGTDPSGPIVDQEAAAAFALATEHLNTAMAALAAAQARLATPAALASIWNQARRASSAVESQTRVVAGLDEQIAALRSEVAIAHDAIGGQARRAYVAGPTVGLRSLLASVDLVDLADRIGTLSVVDRTQATPDATYKAVLRRLKAATASRQSAFDQLQAATSEYTGLVTFAQQRTSESRDAAVQIVDLQSAADAAIAEAKAAVPIDQALAAQRGQESDRLASAIVAAAKQLEEDGGVVRGTGQFARPATGVITSPYGLRIHPILGYLKMHTGIDYDGADGVVYAADDGVVILTVWNTAYGNLTIVDHGKTGGQYFDTFYAHQAGFFVKPGDVVRKGQPIGAVGATGWATGPHLHFEVRLNGLPVDPNPFLPPE